VQEEHISTAPIEGWNDEWLTVHLKTDVSQESGIENAVNYLGFV
jgi:hypothetical protein